MSETEEIVLPLGKSTIFGSGWLYAHDGYARTYVEGLYDMTLGPVSKEIVEEWQEGWDAYHAGLS